MLEVPDKSPGSTYAANEWNEVPGLEMRNLVQNSGQTFNASNNTQLLKAIGILATRAMDYIDSGSANAYVLNAINSYAQITSFATGTMVRFFSNNTNTGTATVTVNNQGPFNILDFTGAPLVGGEIVSGQYITLIDIGGSFRIYNFNDEDVSLALQLANQTAGSEGARVVGNTKNTVYNYSSKAFGYISESGGNYTIENGYNIDSVDRTSQGIVRVNFINELSSINYACITNIQNTTFVHYISSLSNTVSNVLVIAVDSGGNYVDVSFSIDIKLVE